MSLAAISAPQARHCCRSSLTKIEPYPKLERWEGTGEYQRR